MTGRKALVKILLRAECYRRSSLLMALACVRGAAWFSSKPSTQQARNPSPHLLVLPHSPSLAGSVEWIVLKYGAKTDDTVSFVEIKGG